MGHRLALCCAVLLLCCLPAAAAASSGTASEVRERPAAQALLAVGARYQRGGASPETGFDCSGLVAHAFGSAWGVSLPRRSRELSAIGIPVRLQELEPGDLVFYNTRNQPFSHVGIYLGEGRFIHSPRPGKRVRVENLLSPYWRARFNGARRLEPPIES